MGLIGKIALIGIVAIAVLIAVIWDVQNENHKVQPPTTAGDQIREELPENITTEDTPSPETPQEQAPAAIENPEGNGETPEHPVNPVEETETPGDIEEPVTPVENPNQDAPDMPGTGEKYVIQKRDTMFSIAQKFYGNGKLWPAIAAANTDVIPDPDVLKVGAEIVIPPRDKVLGDAPPPTLPSVSETYIVQPGDNLTKISRMHYGTDKYAELIFQANRDKIKNKNILSQGTVLVIPPMPEEDDK